MSERTISGSVKSDGSVHQGSGFHVNRQSAGRYLIVFQPPLVGVSGGMTQILTAGTSAAKPRAIVGSVDGLHASITIEAADGKPCDCDFSFVFSGKSHGYAATPLHGMVTDPTRAVPDPSIGSRAIEPPTIAYPFADRAALLGQIPAPPAGSEPGDYRLKAQQEEVARLKRLMEQVLQPLQAENKMLRSRLELLKRGQDKTLLSASDHLPVTYGLPAATALAKLLKDCEFETVLDFGPGWQERCAALMRADKQVSTLLPVDEDTDAAAAGLTIRRGNLHSALLPTTVDCIIAAHVLHKERDPQRFLRRLNDLLPERAILTLTVPALRYPMLHGELSIWSPGLLLYHLVLAGFNCAEVHVLVEGEEISVIVEKDAIDAWEDGAPLPPLASLRRYLPSSVDFVLEPACFNGDIRNLGW